MKILWVVNHYMFDLANELGKNTPTSGSWLVETSKILSTFQNNELHIACPSDSHSNFGKFINGIHYYTLKMSKIDKFIAPSRELTDSCLKLIEEIKPDIIHLQGCEFAFGLAFLKQRDVPVVISIQGLISEIVRNEYVWCGIKEKNSLKAFLPNNMIIYLPQTLKNIRDIFRGKAEIKQLQLCDYRIGRTNWDEAHSFFHNPEGKYYYMQETMRKSFFQTEWEIKAINRHSIFCAGGYSSALKGAHMVLEAAALLKNEFPNIQVRIIGKDVRTTKDNFGYNRYLTKLIKKLNLDQNIQFIGRLDEKRMAEEFAAANVYVMGSSIENSSNTLGEAMCIGIPIVASFVGGVPSLATDEKEALFYRFGDVELMAWQIRRIFTNDELACSLSENARKRAKKQYCEDDISNGLASIYEDIISSFNK